MRNRAKLLTLSDPGIEIDRLARRYTKWGRWSTKWRKRIKHKDFVYDEKTIGKVLRTHPALVESYNVEPRFRDLCDLAKFLNTVDDGSDQLRREVLSDVRAVLERHATSTMAIAEKLNEMSLSLYFVPVLDQKTEAVSEFSTRLVANDDSERARVYAIFASAVQRSDLNRLRQCRICGDFIVALDHRVFICDKKTCQGKQREIKKERSKLSMRKKRAKARKRKKREAKAISSPAQNFIEFMRLQNKANPTDLEYDKMKPVWRALGDVSRGRKLITGWERTHGITGSSPTDKLERFFRGLSDSDRKIFSEKL